MCIQTKRILRDNIIPVLLAVTTLIIAARHYIRGDMSDFVLWGSMAIINVITAVLHFTKKDA